MQLSEQGHTCLVCLGVTQQPGAAGAGSCLGCRAGRAASPKVAAVSIGKHMEASLYGVTSEEAKCWTDSSVDAHQI